MTHTKPRHYDEEFKLRAVMLFETGEKSLTELSSDLGIPVSTLATWRRKYQNHKNQAFQKDTSLSPAEIEIRKLKKELAIVKEEREILKKALAIFS